MQPDSPSAPVNGAKNANFDYNQIVSDCKPGEQVMYPLGGSPQQNGKSIAKQMKICATDVLAALNQTDNAIVEAK